MSLPPQEPPRGPPPLNVSHQSHKVKKQQPRRPSAVASQSHHPPAPPPLEDYLASLEQQLMSDDGLEELPPLPDNLLPLQNPLIPPPPPMNEIPIAPLQRPAQPDAWIDPFLEQIRFRMLKEREQRMQQQNPIPPYQPVNFPPAPTATHFLPRTPDSFPAGASSLYPNPPPPPPPPVYYPPPPAAAASSYLPNPPPRFHPVTASHSLPGPPDNLRPAASGSLPYIPPPAVAGGSSILQTMPVNSPAAGSSFWPSASSEYSPSASSSAASLPPESSPDGSCSPLTVAEVESYYDGVDSTPPSSPPPDTSA
ncbi:proline-rich receptor-like protein kinase PERK2 [Lotus japonicus]|uniref:proline-rich receptor-like protein kinase PERK2 n=1 Tax=Lotus japonicus TaxID=34305 RepID=UPI00258D2A78|nr:proline-rich receptor-like protein kinase PERK2 [Lotus japonicus]